MMNNFEDIIYFLKNFKDNEHNRKGYESLFNLFKIYAKKFFQYYSDSEILNLYHDFLISKIFSNNTFEKFLNKAKDREIKYYLKTTIRNFLINQHRKEKQFPLTNLDINTQKDDAISVEVKYEISLLLDLINRKLKQRDKMLLCRYINSDKYNFLSELSMDAYYKAIERLKIKLRNIVLEKKISKESSEMFFSEVFLSEICDKICLEYKARGSNE